MEHNKNMYSFSRKNSTGVGRHMNAFVGFKNKKGFRLLGLIFFT